MTDFPKVAYTVEEVAAMMDMHPQSIYHLLRTGKLEHYRIGSAYRIPGRVLDKLLVKEQDNRGRKKQHS